MPEIIAHRGASFDAPENTLESFQLGLEQGADALECDVRLSSDGELMVFHDPTVERTAAIQGAVADLTAAELQTLDAGSWKAAKWSGARIPTLAAVLDLVPADRRILIEVKVGLTALPRLKEIIAATALPRDRMVLMEFDLETVIALRRAFPDIEVLWLIGFPMLSPSWKKRQTLKENIGIAKQHGFDGINVQDIASLNAERIADCRAQELNCYCWTVDRPARAAQLFEDGVYGIATNRPGWIREQLEGPAA